MCALRVRAFGQDVSLAQKIIAALAAESIAAELADAPIAAFGAAPVLDFASGPVLYVFGSKYRSASGVDRYGPVWNFEREIIDGENKGGTVIEVDCSHAGFKSPTTVHVDLNDWDWNDHSFSGYRDLVLACRRALRNSIAMKPLSLDKLRKRRGVFLGARPSLAVAAGSETDAKKKSPTPLPEMRSNSVASREDPLGGGARIGAGGAGVEPSFPSLRDSFPRVRHIGAAGEESVRIGASRGPSDPAGDLGPIRRMRQEFRLGGGRPEGIMPSARPPAPAAPPKPPWPPDAPHTSSSTSRAPSRSSLRSFLGFAAAIAVAGAGIYWRNELFAFAGTVLKFFTGAAPPVPPAPNPAEPVPDIVDVSAFAPASGRAGEQVLVQVFLHALDDTSTAMALAQKADPDTAHRGVATLDVEVANGQRVDIVLEAPGLSIDEPAQFLVWRGRARACQFIVGLPADAAGRTCQLTVRTLVGSIPVGVLKFSLKVLEASEAVSRDPDYRAPDATHRYKRAFLSYASPDRAEVLKRAAMLKAARISFFQDLLELEPGQRWEKRLYEEIDNCDLFLLFWSSKAANSEWVIREAEYALARANSSSGKLPDITPVILEGPPVPLPPDSLRHLHFNDVLCYVIAGIQSENRAH